VIVPMREVAIVTARADQASALAALQEAGVVHVSEQASGTSDALSVARARVEHARRAVDVLAHVAGDGGGTRPTDGGDAEGRASGSSRTAAKRRAEELVAEVERLAERLADLERTRDELEAEQQRLAPFGPFDPASLRRLKSEGLAIRLARVPLRRWPEPVEGAVWVDLGHDRRRQSLALVGPVDVVAAAEVPGEVAAPSEPPERLAHEIAEVEVESSQTRERLARLARSKPLLEAWLLRAEDEVHFEEARAAMATVGAVAVLRGFVPLDEVERVAKLAAERSWGLRVAEVEDEATAPTLIRNPGWVRPIEPLFSFLGVVPGYGQVDISASFLVFFGLFFAIIVGDAGYGLLFLVLSEVARRRLPAAPGRVITLLRALSVATIAWGLASGNFFGVAALPSALAALRLDWLTEERNVMTLAFTIGVVHLTLAHAWNVVRFFNSTRALVEVGWIATTWTMYFLARQLVLGDPFPPLAWVSLGVGVVLIAAFITPWNKLRSEWFTHAMLPLNLVSNFVDVVSYVRLFAVGAATYAVAESFNALAASIDLGGILGAVVSALVLLFGHTLNVLLAAMGVLVHGVRLNTLEFASHLSLSWTGHPYRPFARSAPLDTEGEPAWTPR
jgi:V/A-type H+/Na+-transporting ATPase subunit I